MFIRDRLGCGIVAYLTGAYRQLPARAGWFRMQLEAHIRFEQRAKPIVQMPEAHRNGSIHQDH
jgi:hypothetical protein